MASSGIIFFIFCAICIIAVKTAQSGFVNVNCKAKNVGQFGQHSLLECVVETTKDVHDPTIRVVVWKKISSKMDEVGTALVVFKESLTTQPGYKFAEPSWNVKNMNVSLLITNTIVADDGLYRCTVFTDSGDDSSDTHLSVTAKYSVPTVHSIPEKIIPNSDSKLICNAEGGYPKGELRWFDEHNKDWTNSAEMEATETDSGLFKLSSTLSLLSRSTFSKYTCVVFNESGSKEDEFTFKMPSAHAGDPPGPPKSDNTSKIVAPLVVIGSLIVGLLCALLLYRRRSQHAPHGVPTDESDAQGMVPSPIEDFQALELIANICVISTFIIMIFILLIIQQTSSVFSTYSFFIPGA